MRSRFLLFSASLGSGLPEDPEAAEDPDAEPIRTRAVAAARHGVVLASSPSANEIARHGGGAAEPGRGEGVA